MNEEMLLDLYEFLLKWDIEMCYDGDMWVSVGGTDCFLGNIGERGMLTAANIAEHLKARLDHVAEEYSRLDKIRTQMETIQDSRPKEDKNA